MRPARTANALLRVTLAVIFGLMSLSHGPMMAFARANTSLAAHEMTMPPVAGHHHHSAPQTVADQQDRLAPQMREDAAICYSAGCFVAVAPVAVGAPGSLFTLLEQLRAARAQALVPAILDPLVPPPRLQA